MKPARVAQIFSELVMLGLGLLLILLALEGHFYILQELALWIGLGALLMIWGLRTWLRRGQLNRPLARAMQWIRGGSLLLAGLVMIAMAWLPLENAPIMLAIVGAILAARGLIGSAIAARGLVS